MEWPELPLLPWQSMAPVVLTEVELRRQLQHFVVSDESGRVVGFDQRHRGASIE